MSKKKPNNSLIKIIAGFVIAALLVSNIILWAAHIATLTTYAISDDEKVVCYVKSRETAREAMDEVLEHLAKKDTNISAVESAFHIEKSEGKHETVSAEEASKAVLEAAEAGGTEIRIISTKTVTKPYTPDPVYERDDTMLAGQAEVLKEGTDGEKKVTVSYTSVNGKFKKTKETDREIITEGTPAVIAKGTLGLPDGEAWESYDGYPVCKNGGDIMTTAQNYLGLKYVWAGKDLNSGVDCSGFVIAIYREYGVYLTYPLHEEGISVPYSDAQPGDILYFPGHYGLYLGDGMMVHASSTAGKVVIGSIGGRKILDIRRIVQE